MVATRSSRTAPGPPATGSTAMPSGTVGGSSSSTPAGSKWIRTIPSRRASRSRPGSRSPRRTSSSSSSIRPPGATPPDLEAAELLRRTSSPVLVAANKADNDKRELDAAEFYALGWEETYPISAAHGRGTGDLLDAIVWALPPETPEEIARKAREAEAETWARDVASGFLEPYVVGAEDAVGGGEDGADRIRGRRAMAMGVDEARRSSTRRPAAGTRRWPPTGTGPRSRSPSSVDPTWASRAS